MNQRHQELATQVVNAFRDTLDVVVQESVGEGHFEKLHQLICDALAEELQTTAERVQGLFRELEMGMDRPELEL